LFVSLRATRLALGAVVAILLHPACTAPDRAGDTPGPTETRPRRTVVLPAPVDPGMSLHEALRDRRSVREYRDEPLADEILATLMWAAQGRTQDGASGRTAPSAGGTYPLEVYVATAEGVQRYLPDGHRAERWSEVDLRPALHAASGGQPWVLEAPAVVVITAVPGRTEARYGARAERYATLEAGHAAQNVLLQATALGLGAVPVGAFADEAVGAALDLPAGEAARYLIPVGRPLS